MADKDADYDSNEECLQEEYLNCDVDNFYHPKEEAIPIKCWCRGVKRLPLSQLNIPQFMLEQSYRNLKVNCTEPKRADYILDIGVHEDKWSEEVPPKSSDSEIYQSVKDDNSTCSSKEESNSSPHSSPRENLNSHSPVTEDKFILPGVSEVDKKLNFVADDDATTSDSEIYSNSSLCDLSESDNENYEIAKPKIETHDGLVTSDSKQFNSCKTIPSLQCEKNELSDGSCKDTHSTGNQFNHSVLVNKDKFLLPEVCEANNESNNVLLNEANVNELSTSDSEVYSCPSLGNLSERDNKNFNDIKPEIKRPDVHLKDDLRHLTCEVFRSWENLKYQNANCENLSSVLCDEKIFCLSDNINMHNFGSNDNGAIHLEQNKFGSKSLVRSNDSSLHCSTQCFADEMEHAEFQKGPKHDSWEKLTTPYAALQHFNKKSGMEMRDSNSGNLCKNNKDESPSCSSQHLFDETEHIAMKIGSKHDSQENLSFAYAALQHLKKKSGMEMRNRNTNDYLDKSNSKSSLPCSTQCLFDETDHVALKKGPKHNLREKPVPAIEYLKNRSSMERSNSNSDYMSNNLDNLVDESVGDFFAKRFSSFGIKEDTHLPVDCLKEFPVLPSKVPQRKIYQDTNQEPGTVLSIKSIAKMVFCGVNKQTVNENVDVVKKVESNASHEKLLVIENLPEDIEDGDIKILLQQYGAIQKFSLAKYEDHQVAKVQLDGNLEWAIHCLDGTQPFGDDSEPIKCYQV